LTLVSRLSSIIFYIGGKMEDNSYYTVKIIISLL
jgi:hypothetical protein